MTTDIANEVRRLADRLAAVIPGDIVTYRELSDAVAQDVKRIRPQLYQAIDLVAKESGCVFKTVYKKGYQRLANDELEKIGQTTRRQIRRKARHGSNRMDAALRVANDMSPEMLRKVLREQSALGLIEHAARDRSLPVMSETEKQPLTAGQTARAFMDSIGGLKKGE